MKKQKEMKNLRKASGITLIALVITIVVLIILATVSINMILDDDGIIKSAELAKEKYQNAASKEQGDLATLEVELDDHLPNVDMVKSEDNVFVPVPKGYVASTIAGERKVSEGFVIKKGDNGAATGGVNEFVWVPVSEASFNEMFVTETRNLSGTTGVKTEYHSKNTREPDLATRFDNDTTAAEAGYTNLTAMAQGFVDDYKNMRESIKRYKGFYIGRYELTGSVENPTVQSGVVLKNSSGVTWYKLYKACRNVAKTGEKVTSTMIWGCQWDETMNWLKNTKFKDNTAAVDSDSSSWGNYDSTPQETGYNKEDWSANNIYDLAGNYGEFTQESDGDRQYAGGWYMAPGSIFPATSRYGTIGEGFEDSATTRVTLYINP